MPIERTETGLSLQRASQGQDPESRGRAAPGGDSTGSSSTVVYHGNCHCWNNKFEVRLPVLTAAMSCNCSLCRKSGYLWAVSAVDGVEYSARLDAEDLGAFETETLVHNFCTFCGTGLFGMHKIGPLRDQLAINVRAILGVNPFKIDTDPIDTVANLVEQPISLPPGFPLIDQEPNIDNKKLYTGSCQCGAVAFALRMPPLPEVGIREDNCSIFVRRAAATIYPKRDQVVVVGWENTMVYGFGRGFNYAPFCKTCGVACYGIPADPPDSVVERLSADDQQYVVMQRSIHPLCVRAMDGVEWDEIKIQRCEVGTSGYNNRSSQTSEPLGIEDEAEPDLSQPLQQLSL